ncbi:MAG: hypothetical protein KBD64_03575 [Gammaproteobacteria bacterium]|nr:hypothetical protein [Gammaproteobacteria bacterium]
MDLNSARKNKVTFIWVVITLVITLSIAFANTGHGKTIAQVERQSHLEKTQQELDYPLVESWPVGQGENAVWVEPDQKVEFIGMDDMAIDAPPYKMHLDSNQPITKLSSPERIEKNVNQLELFSWD